MAEARVGSTEALGRLWTTCRDYLLLVANQQFEPDLRSKVSPSDVVQETFLEGQRDLAQFHGDGPDELLAWLRRILLNNLANVSRHYRATQMRALAREVPLADAGVGSGRGHDLPADTPSPSDQAIAHEQAAALLKALARLTEQYRAVLGLRYEQQLTFVEIGVVLSCSAEAARKLWARAVSQLQKDLDVPDAP